MARPPGLSVRLRLTLSYAGFLVVAGTGLIAVVWVFLLRYVPDQAVTLPDSRSPDGARSPVLFVPGRSDLWDAFAPKAALMIGLLLAVGLVGGWLLAGRMLAPLARITEATRSAGSGSLSHRIHLPGRRDEFSELADAFDGMLATLEAHVAEQQRFAANASHELRTPLAITQTMLEVARREGETDVERLLDRLQAVNSRAIDLTEALLLLSRADQRSFEREPVDLSLAAEDAVETLLPLAEARGIGLRASGQPAWTSGSAALLGQLVTNLVHNAIVHNLPDGGTVQVTTAAGSRGPELVVENSGDHVAPHLVATLTEPFQRRAGRTHDAHAGVGLGLAIAQRITVAHDGTLTLDPRAEGGLRVTVRMPAASAPG